ncbi:hypothetical protein NDU88_000261 [Pleurodeles waltl]|uniref:Uncharacterized protein n=1 Tax=Pleurodeles waltl TaxID=8319 RepID=A0AAV7VU56_PLEWA|nr:hypothetical protein NDU88_000261 [Pleurodeles waltl]
MRMRLVRCRSIGRRRDKRQEGGPVDVSMSTKLQEVGEARRSVVPEIEVTGKAASFSMGTNLGTRVSGLGLRRFAVGRGHQKGGQFGDMAVQLKDRSSVKGQEHGTAGFTIIRALPNGEAGFGGKGGDVYRQTKSVYLLEIVEYLQVCSLLRLDGSQVLVLQGDILVSEVEAAIKALPSGKTAGKDAILLEFYKIFCDVLSLEFMHLIGHSDKGGDGISLVEFR